MQTSITVSPIHAFNDNYIWLIDNGKEALVVDPGDAKPVLDSLQSKGLDLVGILNTHHHFDHTGGIESLKQQWPQLQVYGPQSQALSDVKCDDGQTIEPLAGLYLQVYTIPGHTLDHIAFYASTIGQQPALFCGDTLFAGGCGRIFEGSPEQMHQSLQKLAQLDTNTLVYCAHEYTLANLKFALAVEPDNQELQQRFAVDNEKREQNQATVPSQLATELATNPFLRCHLNTLKDAAAQQLGSDHGNPDTLATFTAIRQWKDNF